MKKNYFLLIPLVIVSSCFLINESGQFFQQYSKFENYPLLGYLAAFLVEVFMTLSAATYIKGHSAFNVFIKFLMVCLFVLSVGAASKNAINPLLKELATVKVLERKENLLKLENEQTTENMRILEKQEQRTNTAIELQRQRTTFKEWKKLLDSGKSSSWDFWIDIVFSVGLRILLQFSNLVYVHVFSILYRTDIKSNVNNTQFENLTIHKNKKETIPSSKINLKAVNENTQTDQIPDNSDQAEDHSYKRRFQFHTTNFPNSQTRDNSVIDTPKQNHFIESNSQTQTNQQITLKFENRILAYLRKNNGKATRIQLLSSKIINGGAENYDLVLSGLTKENKITVDESPDFKKLWVYSLVQ